MSTPIVNISDVELQTMPQHFLPSGAAAEKFSMRAAYVSRQLGARKLGYNITVVPSGKCAFPLHNHQVNEEMFFVLEGEGELRVGDETFAIKRGDFIACPPGGKSSAHQIKNTGDVELKYLAVSTMETPELVDYPDSGKFGVYSRSAEKEGGAFRYLGRKENSLNYWEGE